MNCLGKKKNGEGVVPNYPLPRDTRKEKRERSQLTPRKGKDKREIPNGFEERKISLHARPRNRKRKENTFGKGKKKNLKGGKKPPLYAGIGEKRGKKGESGQKSRPFPIRGIRSSELRKGEDYTS